MRELLLISQIERLAVATIQQLGHAENFAGLVA
jgi:hypothetical protein